MITVQVCDDHICITNYTLAGLAWADYHGNTIIVGLALKLIISINLDNPLGPGAMIMG